MSVPFREGVRVVNFDIMSALLPDVSRLLMCAELSLDAIERETAIRRLKSIHETLTADLKATDSAVQAGATSRRVEAAAIRAALTTLADELTTFDVAEARRVRRISP